MKNDLQIVDRFSNTIETLPYNQNTATALKKYSLLQLRRLLLLLDAIDPCRSLEDLVGEYWVQKIVKYLKDYKER